MYKAISLSSCFLLCAFLTVGQQKPISGYLKDSLTHLPVAGGTVFNPAVRTKVQTDASGFFRLPVSPNDLVYALAVRYNYDTLRYSLLFQDTITIYLAPVNVMETVTIEGGYQKYRMDSLQRRLAFEESSGHPLNAVDRSSRKPYFGLTINLDRLFKKKYRNKNKDEQSFLQGERQAYVNYRFPPPLIAYYTGLKGEGLLTFMRLYTPSCEWLRSHLSKERLIDYLSEKLALYRNGLRTDHY